MGDGSTARALLRHYDELFGSGAVGDLTDGQLLAAFLDQKGALRDGAFAALIARHGPMVMGVCERALGDRHAAEDAFQATFLVLARRAGSIRKRHALASWLHGVARRASARLRGDLARLRDGERRHAGRLELARPGPQADVERALDLHAELTRLPEKEREPILLCYFEGLTHEQAAGRLRWPVGTVKVRLARGRERLRRRLERTGGDLSALLLVEAVRDPTSLACCERLLHAARPGGPLPANVFHLTQGVLRTMILQKLKWPAIVLAGLLSAGLGGAVIAQRPPQATTASRPEPGKPSDDQQERHDVVRLAGTTKFDSDATLTIRPRFACRVEKVMVGEGEVVKKDAPLFELFSTELLDAKNAYELARRRWQLEKQVRNERASLVSKGLISKTDLLSSENQELKSRREMEAAREKLNLYGVPADRIERVEDEDADQRGRFTYAAPANGLVVRRNVVVGNLYEVRDVLLEIVPTDHLWITAKVPESRINRVRLGQEVTVTFESRARPVKARIDAIAPAVDPTTGTITIRATLPNRDGTLHAGLSANVILEPVTAEKPDTSQGRPVLPKPAPTTTEGRLEAVERRLDAVEQKLDRLLAPASGK